MAEYPDARDADAPTLCKTCKFSTYERDSRDYCYMFRNPHPALAEGICGQWKPMPTAHDTAKEPKRG